MLDSLNRIADEHASRIDVIDASSFITTGYELLGTKNRALHTVDFHDDVTGSRKHFLLFGHLVPVLQRGGPEHGDRSFLGVSKRNTLLREHSLGRLFG